MTPAARDNAERRALIDLLASRHHLVTEPAILQPATVFLDLTGEDIRRRLYLVQDPEGRELCLRPDYTIPVSRAHLAEGRAERPARYAYMGPVFRYRPSGAGPGEFTQAGVEIYGAPDPEATDAEVMSLALEAVRLFGLERPALRIGDPSILMRFVEELKLPEPWPRRLRAGFGRNGGVLDVLRQAANPPPANDRARFLAALARGDQGAARAAVEEMVSIAGIAPVGGRTPEEIAQRLVEQAELAVAGGLDERAIALLQEVAGVRGGPREALDRLETLARAAGVEVGAALQSWHRRLDALEASGAGAAAMEFVGDFGRRLDYYTGFVFEIDDPARPEVGPMVGGGRYDRLLSLLGAPEEVAAVGCSIWIDRLEQGRAQ
ncbi:ATP phosphoribosyltransferase regulatory subunit [Lutibaculum baratangense]|uniref:Histidine--tRNA ligase n=1 Tax=Lutibaculum baratangense AMV1 TaxID=631454 RepID=V4RQT5_9HYPH|nr:ATP phosphoribosyltransferase regulatory subunit [Lutibaculum baratangense]ESR25495.1 ATP phosphoribosyltransferase regulatory subunit [Lutibaculum baratangense AMV1]